MTILLKILKWAGIVLGALLGLFVLAAVAVYFMAEARLSKTYDFEVATVTIPTDEESIERGKRFATALGLCIDCHGEDLAGKVVEDNPIAIRFVPRNLTKGKGGIGRDHHDIDYVRAIRHGVDHDGRPLIIMPADFFNKLSDADVGAIIAYIKSLPPVDNELPQSNLGPMGRLLLLLGEDFLPAEMIDHSAPRPSTPEPGLTLEYGKYLSLTCVACHGDELAGQVEGEFTGPNITPASEVGEWSDAEFISTIRTGVNPKGDELDPENMPWKNFAKFNDAELKAIWLFVKSVPPVETE